MILPLRPTSPLLLPPSPKVVEVSFFSLYIPFCVVFCILFFSQLSYCLVLLWYVMLFLGFVLVYELSSCSISATGFLGWGSRSFGCWVFPHKPSLCSFILLTAFWFTGTAEVYGLMAIGSAPLPSHSLVTFACKKLYFRRRITLRFWA